jgi:hypothetical protein
MYGTALNGEVIKAPPGWKILPAGERVPHVHREFIDLSNQNRFKGWCAPRRCHSTMTSITACIWGSVRAIAVPEEV